MGRSKPIWRASRFRDLNLAGRVGTGGEVQACAAAGPGAAPRNNCRRRPDYTDIFPSVWLSGALLDGGSVVNLAAADAAIEA